MFDIGFSEMILLAAIALLVIRPKDLPEVARVVGRFLNDLKRTANELTTTVVSARDSTNKIFSEAEKAAAHPQANAEPIKPGETSGPAKGDP